MHRLLPALAALLAAPLLGGAVSPGRTAPELEALGWRKLQWDGIRPPAFSATAGGGVRVQGQGQGAVLTRPLAGTPMTAPLCLSWRWRVDAGPPATDLTRRGGDDRAIAVSVGFAGFGPEAGLSTRVRHGAVQANLAGHTLPRSVLSYVWGGTGREAAGGFFASPWTGPIARLRVLRPAEAPRGQWVEEKVNLGADWRAAFGAAEVPPLQDLAISTDTEDTGSRVDAQVEAIRLGPC